MLPQMDLAGAREAAEHFRGAIMAIDTRAGARTTGGYREHRMRGVQPRCGYSQHHAETGRLCVVCCEEKRTQLRRNGAELFRGTHRRVWTLLQQKPDDLMQNDVNLTDGANVSPGRSGW